MTIIGNSETGITLSASDPSVTLTGSVTGFEPAGYLKVYRSGEGYVYFGLQAVVQGIGGASYRILNTGNVADNLGGTLFVGVLLATPGALTNNGTILSGGGGVYMLGPQSGAYVLSNGLIAGNDGVGVYLLGQAGIHNSGTISGGNGSANPKDAGIYLGSGGIIYNAGSISGARAIAAQGKTTLVNAGKLSAVTNTLAELPEDAVYLATGVVTNAATGTIITNAADFGSLDTPASAIHLAYGGAIINQGLIDGQAGILLSAGGAVSNFGTIGGDAGIEAYGQTAIYNAGSLGYRYLSSFGVLGALGSTTDVFNRHGAVIEGRMGLSLAAGSVQNHGTILGTGYDAIKFSAAGTLDNRGLIVSPDDGPYAGGPAVSLAAGGTVNNTGTIISSGGGIILSGGGLVSNAGAIRTYGNFLYGPTGPGIAVTNGGTIIDSGTIAKFPTAISFAPGFSNILSLAPSAEITGSIFLNGKLDLAAGAGTLTLAQIAGLEALDFGIGANWKLIGTLSPKVAIYNSATLANPAGPGLTLAAPLYNYGFISGATNGIISAGNYLYNSGLIAGQNTGIDLTSHAYVINTGTVSGQSGVQLAANSQFYNYAGAKITGGLTATTNAALYNYARATITAQTAAISLTSGIAYNAGLLSAANGIILATGTVTNLGTIAATTYAVDFLENSAKNRLILAPTARTTGTINLAGGVLELQNGHRATGTIATAPQNLSAVTLDSRANWNFSTPLAIPTLTNNGTLFDQSALTITAALGRGTIVLDSALTLASAAATQKIAFAATPETLTLTTPDAFSATIQNFTLSDTIDLATIPLESITGETLLKNILTLTESTTTLTFTFASLPLHDTFALTASGPGTALTLTTQAAALQPFTHPSTISSLPAITLQP